MACSFCQRLLRAHAREIPENPGKIVVKDQHPPNIWVKSTPPRYSNYILLLRKDALNPILFPCTFLPRSHGLLSLLSPSMPQKSPKQDFYLVENFFSGGVVTSRFAHATLAGPQGPDHLALRQTDSSPQRQKGPSTCETTGRDVTHGPAPPPSPRSQGPPKLQCFPVGQGRMPFSVVAWGCLIPRAELGWLSRRTAFGVAVLCWDELTQGVPPELPLLSNKMQPLK